MTARPDEPAPGAPTPPLPWGRDSLVAAVLPALPARVVAANVSGTVFEAEARHVSARLSAEVTARAAAAVILVGSDLKGDERLSMQVLSDGPLAGLLVEVDANLRFRGYTHRKTAGAHDHDGTPHTAALGTAGRLQMIRSTGGGITYQGITALGDGDLIADVERALRDSQQIPSCQIVDHGYLSPAREQRFDKMRADERCPAGH